MHVPSVFLHPQCFCFAWQAAASHRHPLKIKGCRQLFKRDGDAIRVDTAQPWAAKGVGNGKWQMAGGADNRLSACEQWQKHRLDLTVSRFRWWWPWFEHSAVHLGQSRSSSTHDLLISGLG